MIFSKDDALYMMNRLGKDNLPFFFIIDFEMETIRLFDLSSELPERISYSSENLQFGLPYKKNGTRLNFTLNPISYEAYGYLFQQVLDEINRGNSFLLNLTIPTPINCNYSLTEIYQNATAKYKLLVDNEFVVFSPETFLLINKGKIYSYPMKGTIDASIPNSAELILNNKKEIAEHNTIVDLIRNDLSIVAKDVEVTNFRFINKVETNKGALFQVSSEISGQLPENYSELIGNIIFNLLPAGSITGAPKTKTVEIIRNVEVQKRGYYTGICGYYDGFNLESAVMIRFIENRDGKMFFRSGGGITFQSNPVDEYNELINKVYVPFS